MVKDDVDRSLAVFQALAEMERSIGEVYTNCARCWPAESGFWNRLSAEEEKHAYNLGKMAGMVMSRPQQFWVNELPDLPKIQDYVARLKEISRKLASSAVQYASVLDRAVAFETGILEMQYSKMLETTDDVYNAMLKYFDKETIAHRTALEKLIKGGARPKA